VSVEVGSKLDRGAGLAILGAKKRFGRGIALEIGVRLDFAAAEEIVLIAAWALGATETADQEDCDASGDQQGDETTARGKPMNQSMHSKAA